MQPAKRNAVLPTGISATVLAYCFGGVLTGNVDHGRWSVTDLLTVAGLGLATVFMLIAFVKQVRMAKPDKMDS